MDDRFFDLELYGIYKAIHEKIGPDTWDVVWRSGEIVLDEIWSEINPENSSDVFLVLKNLADYLVRVGYVDFINVEKVSGNRVKYTMGKPVILQGAKRLIEEGMVPPHISTSLMFAALKKLGYRAEMVGEPEFLENDVAVEIWEIKQLED